MNTIRNLIGITLLGLLALQSSAFAGFGLDERYRVGDSWGKVAVNPNTLDQAAPGLRRSAMATARAGGGTSFYLGKFAGQHVMATNHHVFQAAYQCLGNSIRFPILAITAKCSKFFGTWPDIDLALFAIEGLSPSQEATLAPWAGNFAFNASILQDTDLVTVGFGSGSNPTRSLVENSDRDCRVISRTDDFRKMGDPDTYNPGPYKAWSFATGCDASHGDSGSSMVERSTGRVLGILWTGRVPKDPIAQTSAGVDQIQRDNSELIWTELTYAVPASKIGDYLATIRDSGSTSESTRSMLTDLLK
jgi:hypothetical protein